MRHATGAVAAYVSPLVKSGVVREPCSPRIACAFYQIGPSDRVGEALEDGLAVGADDHVSIILTAVRVGRGDPGDGGARGAAHFSYLRILARPADAKVL